MNLQTRLVRLEKTVPSLATMFIWRREHETVDEAIAHEAQAEGVSPTTLAARPNLYVIGWKGRGHA